jgi:hypothetical protein
MTHFLFDTRGWANHQCYLVLIPDQWGQEQAQAFDAGTLRGAVALTTRLGATEIVITGQEQKALLQEFQAKGNTNGFLEWLKKNLPKPKSAKAAAG